MESTGGGVNGNLHKRPEDSPHPELELWREVVDAASAQPIGLSDVGIEALGPEWTEQVSAQRRKPRLRDRDGYQPERGPPPRQDDVPPPPQPPQGAGWSRPAKGGGKTCFRCQQVGHM
eukprot:1393658-Alexandrium_andersonii.AAC.1